MGKKDKKKQGKGQEKTEQKSEAKAAKRTKKEAASKGEDDVEALIAEFVAKDKKQVRRIPVTTALPVRSLRNLRKLLILTMICLGHSRLRRQYDGTSLRPDVFLGLTEVMSVYD